MDPLSQNFDEFFFPNDYKLKQISCANFILSINHENYNNIQLNITQSMREREKEKESRDVSAYNYIFAVSVSTLHTFSISVPYSFPSFFFIFFLFMPFLPILNTFFKDKFKIVFNKSILKTESWKLALDSLIRTFSSQ